MANETRPPRKRGKWLTCPKCGYTWLYRGQSEYRATCPMCFANVMIKRRRTNTPLFATCPHLVHVQGHGGIGVCMYNDDAPTPCITQLRSHYDSVRDVLVLECPHTNLIEIVSLSRFTDEVEVEA